MARELISEGPVLLSLDEGVAHLRLNRPEAANGMSVELLRALYEAIMACHGEPDVRVLLLTGAGKNFCAGANFGASDSAGGKTSTDGQLSNDLYRHAVRIFRSTKPVVAAVQGAAIGGGLGLSLVPDFRVASPEARFGANFVKLGIHQGFGISVTLPRLIGEQQAALMLLTGRRVNGEEALAMGLVDVLTEAENLRAEAMRLATEIAENAPLAVGSVRATLRQGLAEEVAKATEHELSEQLWLRATEDAQEGIRAVAERRPGNFTAR